MDNHKPSLLRRPWVFMDAGDTFVYGYPTFYEALRDCFQQAGIEISPERTEQAVKQFMKSNPPANLISQESFSGYFHNLYQDVLRALAYPGNLDSAAEGLWGEWQQGHRLRLFEDARAALHRLRDAGFRMGVISNWDNTFDAMLERTQVKSLFDFTVASVAVGLSKPDPRIFQYALQATGATADQSWFLGDTPEADIIPAKFMGFRTIFVDYYHKGGGETIADHTVSCLSEAVETIFASENR